MIDATCAVLITGFGPFPGVPHNVSAALAEEVGTEIRRRFPSSNVVTAALPTEWEIAPERVSDLICDLRPSLAVHFGVSDLAHGFVIETLARNETGRIDASGAMPMTPVIEPFGPEEIQTLLPAGRINARLKRLGLPTRLSRDAGTYLCNAVFYRSVLTQHELGLGGRSGFVHLPVAVRDAPGRDTPPRQRRAVNLDFDRARQGGVEIISACLNM
ncbi:MAG: hypothetical protein JXQ99_22875 [Hyphomicrobiaceae bacterium]